MTFRKMVLVPALVIAMSLAFGANMVSAQAQESSSPSYTTIAILVVLSVVATLLIALRFKWIEVSVRPTSESGSLPRTVPLTGQSESTAELSESILGGFRQGLESTRDALVRQKEVLLTERDRLREARGEALEDTRGYFDAAAELKRSRAQVEELSLELARLQERFSLAKEENERIRLELENQRTELGQVRSRLIAERQQVERLQFEVERERAEVEKAVSEVSREWELLHVRKEEIDRARKELFETVAELTKSREQLVAEMKASAGMWGILPRRDSVSS